MSNFFQRRVRLPVSYVRTRGCGLVEDYMNAGESSGQKDDSGDDSDVDEVDSAALDIASQEEVVGTFALYHFGQCANTFAHSSGYVTFIDSNFDRR